MPVAVLWIDVMGSVSMDTPSNVCCHQQVWRETGLGVTDMATVLQDLKPVWLCYQKVWWRIQVVNWRCFLCTEWVEEEKHELSVLQMEKMCFQSKSFHQVSVRALAFIHGDRELLYYSSTDFNILFPRQPGQWRCSCGSYKDEAMNVACIGEWP